MTKTDFNTISNKKFNLFSINDKFKNNILVIDRAKPISIAKSSLIIFTIVKKFKLNPLIFSFYPKNSWQFFFYKNFGNFKFISSSDYYYYFKNFYLIFVSLYKAIIGYLKWKNNLLGFINSFNVNNVEIGHLIYDEYIRHGFRYKNLNSMSLNFLFLLFRKILSFLKIKKIIEENNVKILVCSSIDYATYAGLAARIAVSKKIPVLHIDGQFHIITKKKNINESLFRFNKDEFKMFYKKEKNVNFNTFFNKRLSGKIRTVMAGKKDLVSANSKKKDVDRKTFLKKYAKKINYKKIALFAPHAFTDANHGTGKNFIFEGYYDQFEKTIKFIYNLKKEDTLWVINPHPSSKDYNEHGQVEEIINKFKKNNIILLPKNIKTVSAIKFSDLIITGRGTIGLEAACLKKKTILAGYAIYEKLGFTIEPKNQNEYFKNLVNEENYKPLKSKIAKKALKYLYYFDQHNSNHLPSNPMDFYHFSKKNKFYNFLFNFINEKKYLTDDYYKMVTKIINKVKI